MADARVVLAVDGNSLVHRAYHAAASAATALTASPSAMNEPVWAVRGLLTQIVAGVERVGADAVVVGFDDCESSARRDRWPQYKQQRSDKAQCLVDQLALAAEVLRQTGIAVVVPTGLEADDVLASTAAYAKTAGASTVIMTSDRDSFALIDETTSVLRIINGGVDASPLLTEARFPMLLGITGRQYRDYAALRGDPSDNLPGVRGIGPKTAGKLLAALGSAEAAFADLAAGGGRVLAAVGAAAARRLNDPAAREAWQLNCQVMAMHTDVALGVDLHVQEGPGLLPLQPGELRRAYDRLRLIYSLPTALRVLAGAQDQEPASAFEPEPGYRVSRDALTSKSQTSEYQASEFQTSDSRHAVSRSPRFPRLSPRPAAHPEPLVQQLSLFA